MDIEIVRQKIRSQEYIFSLHAEEERKVENILIEEVEEAVLAGKIIEDYPNDPRGESCLIWGKSKDRDIHAVCGWTKFQWLLIITVYLPKMPKWETPEKRFKKE